MTSASAIVEVITSLGAISSPLNNVYNRAISVGAAKLDYPNRRQGARVPLICRIPLIQGSILSAFKASAVRTNILYPVLASVLFLGVSSRPAMAAQLSGVTLPDTATVGTTKLILNGIGLRTYSLLNIQIYVAGLYLEEPNHDAPAILSSGGFKLLKLHFVHDVDSDAVRHAWQTGLLNNCSPPCMLSPPTLSRFLAGLRSMHAGDTVTFVFGPEEADAYYNGLPDGRILDPQLSKLILAVFIGQKPASPQLKDELLGQP